ncbi:MAG: GntR family transcriptional regulator [Burkholderiaceae bacterium]
MDDASFSSNVDVPAPLFAQVRDALRGDILRGSLRPGDRLPSESALITRFGVSRITVRQAISELQAQGLVKTLNGKGSYVTRPGRGESRGPLVGVLESMRKRGHRAHGKLLSYRKVKASRVVARELEVPDGSLVGAVTVLRYCDDVPFVVGTTWCAVEIADRLVEEDLSEQDVSVAIEDSLGFRSARMHVRVAAAVADDKMARRLDYTPGAAILRVYTTAIGWDQRPVVYGETDCRADMMDYRVTLRS